ncbi:hypothetical protein Calag_0972 [Caldisphaera lagunensis DSM 15908]|uniref:Uncharacterized protein n=1 Tax=Caldisphaera lagunensis (strain DSM 15908 / JCM 11604 / ANMR 0165 / IC-154) TaxID=1056495 RepID=L0ACC9_CALLD|nr:hypothetical protein Calag_0972 [Caldisphaera lagunensis DSM 15908]
MESLNDYFIDLDILSHRSIKRLVIFSLFVIIILIFETHNFVYVFSQKN